MEEGCRTSRHVTVWTGMQRQEGREGVCVGRGGETSVSTFLSLSPFLLLLLFLLSWPAAARERGKRFIFLFFKKKKKKV